MNLTIEAGALTIFWGSCLANLVWANRQAILSTTKKYASDAATYVINKSKKIIKKEKHTSKHQNHVTEFIKQQNVQVEQDIEAAKKMELQNIQETPQQKKKEKRKNRRHKNLRKITKNYEEWLLRRAYLRKVQQAPSNEFKQYLRQFEERKMSEEMFLSKPKEIQNMEQFEKYVEEQLDIDQQDEMECILPYDPFVSEEEQIK